MKDEMAGGFRAAVLHPSPVDVIDHKRVKPSQTIPDPCSEPSSSDDKKVPHIDSVHAHRVLRLCGFMLWPSYIFTRLYLLRLLYDQ